MATMMTNKVRKKAK